MPPPAIRWAGLYETMEPEIFAYGLKTERRKKRLQKWGKGKHLMKLKRRCTKLWEEKNKLGYIELERPVESGWERYLVLRKDVAQSSEAAFFQKILDRINTRQLCSRKDFTKRDRKTKKMVPMIQHSRRLSSEEFRKCGFTDKEKECFEYKVFRHENGYRARVHVFLEEWRFDYKVKKHFITHIKVHDNVLEQQIAELEKLMYGYKETGLLNKLYGLSKYKSYTEKDKVLRKDQERSLKEILLENNLRMP